MTFAVPTSQTAAPARVAPAIRAAVGPLTPRRRFQLALAALWLLDAALQYQPYMFTKTFVNQTLASTAAGNPGVIAHPITWAADLIAHHIALYNALFATIQLAIALGLLLRPTVKVALAASVGWALAVWWFGEGLGGVLTGAVNPFMGAPGAVVLYAFLAVLVWPRDDETGEGSVATSGVLGPRVSRLLALSMWASFVYFMLQPVNRDNTSLGAMVSGMDDGEPGWLRSMDHTLGTAITGHGTAVAYVFVALCLVAGLGLFVPRLVPTAVAAGIVLGAAIWVAEDFGGIFTGRGTDPNSGPLVALLAASFWPIGTPILPWRRRRPASWGANA